MVSNLEYSRRHPKDPFRDVDGTKLGDVAPLPSSNRGLNQIGSSPANKHPDVGDQLIDSPF